MGGSLWEEMLLCWLDGDAVNPPGADSPLGVVLSGAAPAPDADRFRLTREPAVLRQTETAPSEPDATSRAADVIAFDDPASVSNSSGN